MNTNRIPLQGLIEITNVCNFKCIHCYVINSKKKKKSFLSYDIITSVIDEVCEMGCKMISISGGECMLHPDFSKIYTYIWKKGIKVNIFTNASLITESIISLLKKYPPNCVSVSIYGASELTYREITKSFSYTDVIDGLRLLQCNGINLQTKIIVLKQNENEIEEMKRLARKYTSNPIRISYDLMPTYDYSLEVLNNQSHYEYIANSESKTNNQLFNCHAGTSFFSINYEGYVTLCSFCGFSAMNLKEYSFHDIWESFEKFINLPIPKDSQCYDCIFLNKCLNCPARTWMFNQKIGLYPIPKCKKSKNQIGGFFMKIRKLFLGSFVTVNNINYFRLDNGMIAVEKTKNVTIPTLEDDTVELITLENAKKEIRFWRINNNKLFALASSSQITVPEDINFDDVYFSENYPEGQYVKYTSADRCGIIYVSETEVSEVISYKECYTEISFENNVFYATAKDGENKYHVIGESGKLLGTFPSKCRKLDKYLLFYDESKIYINSCEFEIDDGILSVNVINMGNFTFIKVINDKGMYLFTKEMICLFGPIKCDEELGYTILNDDSLFIYVTLKDTLIQVSFVNLKNNIHEYIFCKKGINIHRFKWHQNMIYFFSTNNILYTFKDETNFIPLTKNVDDVTYKVYLNDSKKSEITIVTFKNQKPICYEYYDIEEQTKGDEHTLDFISEGWEEDTYICKEVSKNTIVGVTKEGKIVFEVKGENIYKTIYSIVYPNQKVYLVTEKENKILLLSTDGNYLSLY